MLRPDRIEARSPGTSTARLDGVLAELIATCPDIARHVAPFLSPAAERIADQCGRDAEYVPEPRPVFPRLEIA